MLKPSLINNDSVMVVCLSRTMLQKRCQIIEVLRLMHRVLKEKKTKVSYSCLNFFTASCENAMTLSVPGIPASCKKFPHSSQLNF
jgi:hypothetical protein